MSSFATISLVRQVLPSTTSTIELVHPSTDTTNPYWLRPGSTISSPPKLIYSERLRTGFPGAAMEPITHRPKDIVLPILVRSQSAEDLPDDIEALLEFVDPVVGRRDYDGRPNFLKLSTKRTEDTYFRFADNLMLVSAIVKPWITYYDNSTIVTLVLRMPVPYHTAQSGRGVSLSIAAPGSLGATDTATISAGPQPGSVPSWQIEWTINLRQAVKVTNTTTGKNFTAYPDPAYAGTTELTINSNPLRRTVTSLEVGVGTLREGAWDLVTGSLFPFLEGDGLEMELLAAESTIATTVDFAGFGWFPTA